MGTEILKEQYNLLMSEQKSKLEKIRFKKQQATFSSTPLRLDEMNNIKIQDENDSDLEMKNDDLDLYPKFELFDNSDSSNDDQNPNNRARNSKKIVIKKNLKRADGSKQQHNESKHDENSNLDSIRESLSFADKLREMNDENGRLRKVLAEKDYEINSLRKKIEDERAVLGSFSTDVAATKIVDLAKKVRELTSQLESERTRNKQLTKNSKDLEDKYERLVDSRQKSGGGGNNDADSESEEKKRNLSRENRELKDKLNQTCHKMMEFKSQCEILKQDLKKHQKALEKECGENLDVKSILSGQSNWKGRQQQIRNLQAKLGHLKQQIGMMDARSSQMLDEDDYEEAFGKESDGNGSKSAQISVFSGFMSNAAPVRTNLHKNDIRRLEKDRKENNERMKREFEALENDFNATKEKLDAMKARNAVLANENRTYKDQVKTLLEKGKHDDELIDALMKKQAQLKDVLENLSIQNESNTKEVEEKTKEVQIKAMQEKNTIELLKGIIAERDRRINKMEEEIEQLQENLAVKRMTSNEQFFLRSPNSNINANAVENTEFLNPIAQSQISTTSKTKLSVKSRSDSATSTEHEENLVRARSKQGTRPNSSNGGLNAKLIDHQKERDSDLKKEICEIKTLYKTSEIERLRLLELAKAFQKRIEEINEKLIECENKMNEQRRRNANLEKQLEKIKLQDSKNSGNLKQKSTNNVTMDQYKMEELETSLLIQKDENDALKAALKSTLEAKEEDLRLYCEMLESTKRVFLDGLKQYKYIATTN